jgi:hypothetical protein
MSYIFYEIIEVPLVYTQKVKTIVQNRKYEDIGEPLGPFSSATEASRFVHDKTFGGMYAIIDQHKVVNGYRFFTKGVQKITFKNLDIRAAKEAGFLT